MSINESSNWQNEFNDLLQLAETEADLQYLETLLAEHEPKGSGVSSAPDTNNYPDVNRWVVSTLGEVAEFLGVEAQTVREWRTGRNAMPGEEGRWDLRDITQWRCNRLKVNAGGQKTSVMIELEERELRANVEKKELALMNERGLLVERKAVAAQLAAVLNDCRNQIEAIPSELSPSIPAELRTELQHQMTQRVALILRKMSQRSE